MSKKRGKIRGNHLDRQISKMKRKLNVWEEREDRRWRREKGLSVRNDAGWCKILGEK
jgi:hypothetical protein